MSAMGGILLWLNAGGICEQRREKAQGYAKCLYPSATIAVQIIFVERTVLEISA